MATDGPPAIVEPSPPANGDEAGPSLVAPSPTISLSSQSSSHPDSAYSNDTSQSELPSPLEERNKVTLSTASTFVDQGSTAPVNTPAFAQDSSNTPQPVNGQDASVSDGIPGTPEVASSGLNRNRDQGNGRISAWWSTLRNKYGGRRWLEQFIGICSLGVALWLGVRTYKLAVWSSWNDHVQLCVNFKQVYPPFNQAKVMF